MKGGRSREKAAWKEGLEQSQPGLSGSGPRCCGETPPLFYPNADSVPILSLSEKQTL